MSLFHISSIRLLLHHQTNELVKQHCLIVASVESEVILIQISLDIFGQYMAMYAEQPIPKVCDMCETLGQQVSIFIYLHVVFDSQQLIISFFTDIHFSIGAYMLFKESLNVFWR